MKTFGKPQYSSVSLLKNTPGQTRGKSERIYLGPFIYAPVEFLCWQLSANIRLTV